MSLEEYRQKRVFSRTPEPEPQTPERPGKRFFIQRHSARRLHYDLRLEMDGALKSWALPHGPTLDPEVKRLAVHVEDHPLDYGNFEGTIPSGNYGAGSVTVWDRGTYEWVGEKSPAEQWKAGDLKFRLHGQKLAGEFALVRTNRSKGKDWLLIKKKDFAVRSGWDPEADIRSVLQAANDPVSVEGAVKAEMPKTISPMLASLGTSLPSGADWIYEVKWDGYRAICFLEQGRIRMISRRNNPMDKQFPEIARALQDTVKADCAILDGEIVAFDETGVTSFQLLQNRTGFRRSAVNTSKPNALCFFAFDLLYLSGYDLRKAALIDRRQMLSSIIHPNETVRYSDHFVGKGRELLNAVREKGLEGIVAKQSQSRYEAKRTSSWIKIKVTCQQDFVICGLIRGEREPFGALALGYYRDKELVYAGNVGSGFTQQSLKVLGEELAPLTTKTPALRHVPREVGEVRWVKPELVCVVKFQSWTDDERLRAPVFLAMRTDVLPRDVVRETGLNVPDLPLRPDRAHHALLPPEPNEAVLTIQSRRLKFTNLQKVFYPSDGYTKRDIVNFYGSVADLLVPHLQGRPLSL
ncbi:MAG: non-homologous end-joining DNA ligase, partial [Candidatus Angelobacter sp.]